MLITLTFAVVGCSAESDLGAASKPSPVVTPKAAPVASEEAIAITASVRAHDGGPLRQAEFSITRPGATTAAAKGALTADGTLRVDVEPGLYMLRPAGRSANVTLLGEAPELSALRTYRERWKPRLAELAATMQRVDGKILEPSDEEKSALAALSAAALEAVDSAASDDARMLLRLAHLDLFAGWASAPTARRPQPRGEEPPLGRVAAHGLIGEALGERGRGASHSQLPGPSTRAISPRPSPSS